MTTTRAMPVMIHGMRFGAPPPPGFSVAPQWWQNCAPGVSAPSQLGHSAPLSAEPQFAQNWPEAGWPQRGQELDTDGRRKVVGGRLIRGRRRNMRKLTEPLRNWAFSALP